MGDVKIEHHYYPTGYGGPTFRDGENRSAETLSETDFLEAQSNFSQYAANELATLGDWGLMQVPWHTVSPDRFTPAATGQMEGESDLAAYVAAGGQLVILVLQRHFVMWPRAGVGRRRPLHDHQCL